MKPEIPMPTPQERNAAVKSIVRQGLSDRKSLFGLLLEMKEVFGFRELFFGIGDCLYLTFLFVAIVYVFLLSVSERVLYTAVFTASPMLYLTAWLLTVWKEHMSDTLVLQSICKYTPVHITAIRMLSFSVLSMAVDIPVAAVSSYLYDSSFWRLLLLSFCALFIYAVVLLGTLLFVRVKYVSALLPLAWLIFCLLPLLIEKLEWEILLQGISIPILLICLLLFSFVYLFMLNGYVRKGENYADS